MGLITLNDAAVIIGCQPDTLRARIHNRPGLVVTLGGRKFGTQWAFDSKKVETYARNKRVNRQS